MSVTRETLPWSPTDTTLWATFLNTETGRRLIPKLAEAAPLLLPGGELNAVLIRSGELRGFQLALHELLNLTAVQEPEQSSTQEAYPALLDNKAWTHAPGIASEEIK